MGFDETGDVGRVEFGVRLRARDMRFIGLLAME